MEYFLFKLSCFIMTVHASSLKIFPLPAESYSGGGLEKTLELWISQEKCCNFRSSNLWKECRNVKVHLQGIPSYFAKRSVFTLKKLEYFCWQEIAQLRTTVFISASRNTINKAILFLMFISSQDCTLCMSTLRQLKNSYFSSYGVFVQDIMTRTMRLSMSLARQKVYI